MIEQSLFVKRVKDIGCSHFTIIDDRLKREINAKNSYLLGTKPFPYSDFLDQANKYPRITRAITL